MGNLRTAMVAWCVARGRNGMFVLRMDDLTTGRRPSAERKQIADLDRMGITFDGEIMRQSERIDAYADAVRKLIELGRTYECYCSRREIRLAGDAPHGPLGAYPGTCRDLSDEQRREQRRRLAEQGRAPALRLRSDSVMVDFMDRIAGPQQGQVDDFVIQRGDGIAAYNLAVVIDDAEVGVDHVVRGDDLLESTLRQILLARMLDLAIPEFIHVPLTIGPDGQRLSKRHGSVSLDEHLGRHPEGITGVISLLAESLNQSVGRDDPGIDDVLSSFDLDLIPRQPWVFDPSG